MLNQPDTLPTSSEITTKKAKPTKPKPTNQPTNQKTPTKNPNQNKQTNKQKTRPNQTKRSTSISYNTLIARLQNIEMKLVQVDAKIIGKLYSDSRFLLSVLKKGFTKAEGIYSATVISQSY